MSFYNKKCVEAHNIAVCEGSQYTVPSGNFTFNFPSVPATSENLNPYLQAAICGAGNSNHDNVMVRDVLDTIVNIIREITPTCKFPIVRSHLFVLFTRPQTESEAFGLLGTRKRRYFRRTHSDSTLPSYNSYG